MVGGGGADEFDELETEEGEVKGCVCVEELDRAWLAAWYFKGHCEDCFVCVCVGHTED